MEIQRTQWPCSIVISYIELAEGVCLESLKLQMGVSKKWWEILKMATSKDDMFYKMTRNHWSCCIF
jgi:hypothetical protein